MEITSAAVAISMSIALVVFGISYYYFTTRHKERMAMLEKGLSPDFFKDTISYLPFVLLLGIVSLGIALGIAAGAFLWSLHLEEAEDFIFPFVIFLFLGISLLVSYFVLKSIQKRP